MGGPVRPEDDDTVTPTHQIQVLQCCPRPVVHGHGRDLERNLVKSLEMFRARREVKLGVTMASNIHRGGQLRQPVSYPYPAPTLAAPRIRRRTLSASDSRRNTVVVGGQAAMRNKTGRIRWTRARICTWPRPQNRDGDETRSMIEPRTDDLSLPEWLPRHYLRKYSSRLRRD
jgi:hypothetical protein